LRGSRFRLTFHVACPCFPPTEAPFLLCRFRSFPSRIVSDHSKCESFFACSLFLDIFLSSSILSRVAQITQVPFEGVHVHRNSAEHRHKAPHNPSRIYFQKSSRPHRSRTGVAWPSRFDQQLLRLWPGIAPLPSCNAVFGIARVHFVPEGRTVLAVCRSVIAKRVCTWGLLLYELHLRGTARLGLEHKQAEKSTSI
jgi:hypothetical protein